MLWSDVVWSLRPFAKRRVSTPGVLTSLLAGGAGIAFLTLQVADGIGIAELVTLTGATMAGAAFLTVAVHSERDPRLGLASANLLTDAEVQRSKDETDRWILVTGAPSCGKSSLINAMLRAAGDAPIGRGGWVALGAPRTHQDAAGLSVETDLRSTDGRVRRTRIVETSRLDLIPTKNGLSDIDVIVLMLDPTQLDEIGSSFPQSVRPPAPFAEDGNRLVQQMATMLERTEDKRPLAWAVIAKADLLRFSVAPSLVAFPVAVGPRWREQMGRMPIPERRRLSAAMGLTQLSQEHVSFAWGGGNPLLVSEPTDGGGRKGFGFGGAGVLAAILDSVA